MRKKIGLDFDGVIADPQPLKSQIAHEMYGVEIDPMKFRKALVIGSGILTKEQYKVVQSQVYDIPRPMNPVPGALEHVAQLLKEGHMVHVVTSRPGQALKSAKDWLKEFGMNLPIVSVGVGVSKAGASKDSDVLVDDDLDKLEPLVGIVPMLLLYSWGYNAHEKEHSGISRVWSWVELYDRLTKK